MISINQSWGAYAGGRVTSPTLRHHPWRSRLASLHADSPSEASKGVTQCGKEMISSKNLEYKENIDGIPLITFSNLDH